ncbi:hypothetical protein [Pseudothermotoga sp.]|nr:hypothetical protein [Pseudothermotoga sp.]MCX7812660.1 hypothetical protein [Pseudothermotoga sp.]MDW8138940.1 hypothetical protein [Pseudothermotoga sp.]
MPESVANPTLGYKLDPGELGLWNSAPASRSILRVLSQEISNWLYFKRKVEREGGVIIQGGISLDLRKRGSFLAAVAGRTSVWVYYPGERAQSNEFSEQSYKQYIEEKIRQLESQLAFATPEEKEKLEQQIQLLEIAMNLPLQLIKMLFEPLGLFLNAVV